MKLKFEKVTDADLPVFEKTMDIVSMPVYGVAVRCAGGFPQVVVLNPVINAESGELNYNALSNILWLTCPRIKEAVSKLEKEGAVPRMQQMLAHDRLLANDMTDAHAHYYFFRKEIYRQITGRDYAENQIHSFDSGIGGLHDVKQVKCLHSHYAHYMICPSNVVGRAVAGAVGCRECPAGDYRCMKK